MLFTFFTNLGANLLRDIYGDLNWENPEPVNKFFGTGNLGIFQDFVGCFVSANSLVTVQSMLRWWPARLSILLRPYLELTSKLLLIRPRSLRVVRFVLVSWFLKISSSLVGT